MSDEPPTLAVLLADVAKQSKLGSAGESTEAHQALRAALQSDAAMRAEAQRKLDAITSAIAQRDYVSRWTKKTLLAALADTEEVSEP